MSDQLTTFGCSFENDPYTPRPRERLKVDRRQDQAAEVARLDRQSARARTRYERANAEEADLRPAELRATLASMPDSAAFFEAGDLDGAFNAARRAWPSTTRRPGTA
jgi:hypothetical protein